MYFLFIIWVTGPVIKYEFENGVVELDSDGIIIGRFADGHVKKYGDPSESYMNKLWDSIKAVRSGGNVVCGIDAALSQLLCISAAQKPTSEIGEFSKDMIVVDNTGDADDNDTLTWVKGLQDTLFDCYEKNILPEGTLNE